MEGSVLELLELCTPELQDRAEVKGADALKERDFQVALESASDARSCPVQLERWPQVGPVDLWLPDGIALELKWCNKGDTLCNCVWDIAKLACARAEGAVDEAFIAAGAPKRHWDSRARGTELFTSAVHGDDLVRHYESWWRFWCADVTTRPIALPAAIAVRDEGAVPAELDGVPFMLRVARVDVADSAWRVHVCPHRLRGERCRRRPWDPDGVDDLLE